MKFRIFITLIILFLLVFSGSIYRTIQGPIESEIAVNQLKDSITAYSVSREVARNELILKVFRSVNLVVLFFIWITPLIKLIKKERENESLDI